VQPPEEEELREKDAEDGVVLHQPLNLRIFLIFGKKGQKMNGVSVSPGQKSQNAPTWQVENTARRRLFFTISRPVDTSPTSFTVPNSACSPVNNFYTLLMDLLFL